MNFLYLALIRLGVALLTRKIEQDTLDTEARQKLVDDVQAQWLKVNAAHVALQIQETPVVPKP